MHTLIVFAGFALIAVAIAAVAYSIIAALRLARALASVPTARAGLAAPAPEGGWPGVCVIVPAHNEEDVIGVLARSLAAQDYSRLRVVFALDRCTDNTENAARAAVGDDRRFEFVRIGACPDDWAGKCHAAWRGVRDSAGARDADLLLFADADTVFDPRCVRATAALLHLRALDMLSLLSTLTHRTWFERLAQPVAALELMRHFPLERINRAERGRAFANGQFMLFRRDAYDRAGGHESVRQELLEDLAFARRLKRDGMSVGVLLADGLLGCRMYASWSAFRRGWKRIYIESAQRRPARLRAWGRALLASAVALPLGAGSCAALGLVAWRLDDRPLGAWCMGVGAAGLLAWFAVAAAIHRAQRAPLWTALLHPLGAWLVAGLLREAAADLRAGRGVAWAGRVYLRETR